MEQQKNETRAQKEIGEFVTLFPQVKPEDIPQGVWQQVRAGKNLALSYCMDRMEALERELAALKNKKRGEALSTGSVSSAGSEPESALAAYWDAYER